MSQHDPEIDVFDVRDKLMCAVIAWEVAGCPCCAPSVLDEALEGLSDEDWRRLRVFAASLSFAAQSQADDQAGCTCSESMEPCPIHNVALAAALSRSGERPPGAVGRSTHDLR